MSLYEQAGKALAKCLIEKWNNTSCELVGRLWEQKVIHDTVRFVIVQLRLRNGVVKLLHKYVQTSGVGVPTTGTAWGSAF